MIITTLINQLIMKPYFWGKNDEKYDVDINQKKSRIF